MVRNKVEVILEEEKKLLSKEERNVLRFLRSKEGKLWAAKKRLVGN